MAALELVAPVEWQVLTGPWVLLEMVRESIKTSGLVWGNTACDALICCLEKSHRHSSNADSVDETWYLHFIFCLPRTTHASGMWHKKEDIGEGMYFVGASRCGPRLEKLTSFEFLNKYILKSQQIKKKSKLE